MNISLAPELEDLIHQKVESGRYNSASEVIGKALRLLEEQELQGAKRLEEIKHEIALGLKDLDEGRSMPLNEQTLETIKSRIRERASANK